MTNQEAKIRPESGEVAAKKVALIIASWFLFVFVALAVLLRLNQAVHRGPPPKPNAFPVPRLITKPYNEYPQYLHDQNRQLEGITPGQGQSNSGTPINQAMKALLKRSDPYAPLGSPWEAPRS